MKYNQIEAFYQVMLTGSISQAASNLGRTQPAVSMTIATLEEQLGTRLFDRRAGRITPRAEAKVLFEQISPVMQQLRDIRSRFSRLDTVPMPRISIMAASNAAMSLVPSVVLDFASLGQEFRIMDGTASAVVSEMENQRHDLAITDRGVTDIALTSPLYDAEIFHIPMCAIYSRGLLPETGKPLVTGDLQGRRICSLYEQNMAAQDIRPQLGSPSVEFQSFFPMACYAVASGSVAVADYITCTAMKALTGGTLATEWREITDLTAAPYYLMRSRYRPRSRIVDRCHDALRDALIRHQAVEAYKVP